MNLDGRSQVCYLHDTSYDHPSNKILLCGADLKEPKKRV